MSDRNLILGAAAAADKFNTGLAATVDRSVASARANINKMFSDVQNYRDKVDARALNIINQFPEDIEFNKVDNLHVDKLQEWATGKKQQYFESARALAQTRPGSPEFLQLQSQLNNIKKSYVNVNNNLINLQAKRNEWSKNYGNISDGLNVEKKEALNKLLLPDANYQLDIDDSGSSVYTVQIDNGKNIKLTADDLNWPEKDIEFYNQANQIGGAFASAGSKGLQINPGDYNYNNAVGQLNVLLSKDTKNRMLSIANDDIFDGYKLNLSAEEKAQIINDPGPNSKNIVINKLLEHFQRINENAYNQYLLNNSANNDSNEKTINLTATEEQRRETAQLNIKNLRKSLNNMQTPFQFAPLNQPGKLKIKQDLGNVITNIIDADGGQVIGQKIVDENGNEVPTGKFFLTKMNNQGTIVKRMDITDLMDKYILGDKEPLFKKIEDGIYNTEEVDYRNNPSENIL